MLRRLAAVLAGALIAATLVVSSAPQASAQQGCTGAGTATLSVGLQYPLPGNTARSASFNFSLNTGVCAPSLGTLSASGGVSGFCGDSSGSGTTNTGASFTFRGIGSMLVITGGITGAVNASPDVVNGHSCTSAAGASRFVVTGGGVQV